MLVEQVKTRDDTLEMMIAGIQSMLDYVGLEQPKGGRLPDDGLHQSAWTNFKEFARSVTHGAVVHALAQLKSH